MAIIWSHYLNQCWDIVNWTLRNMLQWNFNQNIKLFIHKNTTENVFSEMAAILSSGRWANSSWPWVVYVCCKNSSHFPSDADIYIYIYTCTVKPLNIRHTNSQISNVPRLVLQLSLPNPLKPSVKSRKEMWQALLQLHLSDQQLYYQLRCALY